MAMTSMPHQYAAKISGRIIAMAASIPESWVTTHSMYDVVWDEYVIRVDCMGYSLNFRMPSFVRNITEDDENYQKARAFVMLLWGEPQAGMGMP